MNYQEEVKINFIFVFSLHPNSTSNSSHDFTFKFIVKFMKIHLVDIVFVKQNDSSQVFLTNLQALYTGYMITMV